MARTKKPPRATTLPTITFMNYNMDKREKGLFNDWLAEAGNKAILAVKETVEDEYKFSLSYDPDKECYIASLTGREDSLNPGRCLVVRSADWERAFFALAYIHIVTFSGEVWDLDVADNLV